MNRLREELNRLLAGIPTRRPAALRRSLREDWLYATDLVRAGGEAAAGQFLASAREAGWQAEIRDGWIELDKPVVSPPEGWAPGRPGPETMRCLSLTTRKHPNREDPGGQDAAGAKARAIRLLIKAGEAGDAAWEDACEMLHREWAGRLRERKTIPLVDAGFLIRKET